ncbi:hypothetical protein LTS18_014591 [Coniosporium uncinatum]|uniref:Uncharacterized protein n=1 Tax=Coniosporium uncinatum TaxID=93489 RepID=A0ACC3DVQ5_9PEZI|nr:hypothetical protein LTS18_014591 [Coniosporium uncinatum]
MSSTTATELQALIDPGTDIQRPSSTITVRRSSDSDAVRPSATALGVPVRPPNTRQPSSSGSGFDKPSIPADPKSAETATLLIGHPAKPFHLPRHLLTHHSTYFRHAFSPASTSPSTPSALAAGPMAFPALDTFAFTLFVRWLEHPAARLAGPYDFHSMHHHIGLYAIGVLFGIRGLQNAVMDAVRDYYRKGGMTAPAYRLEYIYDISAAALPAGGSGGSGGGGGAAGRGHGRGAALNPNHGAGPTDEHSSTTTPKHANLTAEKSDKLDKSNANVNAAPNAMQRFLVSTTAYRILCESKISDSMREIVARGGQLAVDLVGEIVRLHKDEVRDVRRSADCEFHIHDRGERCRERRSLEPYES